jgi:hypothetical protein
MSDDRIEGLEKLASLHQRGELTDAEFAAAKRSVLNGPTQAQPKPAAQPPGAGVTFTSAPSQWSFPRAREAPTRRARSWRSPAVVIAAVFCGFMFASAVTAAAPSSALWAGRFVCDSPYHLVHNSSDTSYGTTSQTTIDFACVNGSARPQSVGTLEIFGLQLVLGTLVSLVVLAAGAAALSLRRSPE